MTESVESKEIDREGNECEKKSSGEIGSGSVSQEETEAERDDEYDEGE